MTKRRTQGRPTRGLNEVGRDKIVEHLREMMRDDSIQHISRKGLAEYAGITPALITYYFPTRTSLVREATMPIVAAYFEEMRDILASHEASTHRLRKVIRLLLTCFSRDQRLLTAYRDLIRTDAGTDDPDYVEAMAAELSAFFASLIGATHAHSADVDVLRCAVWGLCATVAQNRTDAPTRGLGRALPEADAAYKIYDFITQGLSRWIPDVGRELPGLEGRNLHGEQPSGTF